MKALVIHGKGLPFSLEDRELEPLKSGYARVKVYAASFNRRDYWIQQGQYAGLKYPIILGSDGAGVVEEINSDEGSALKWQGKEVLISPSLNWKEDADVQPVDFKILGLPDDGTFAEYVDVPVDNLFAKPSYLNFQQAAAFPLGGLTAYRALFKKGNLRPGQNVLITGIGGGVATLLLQFAVAAKANVYVTSSSDVKLKKAGELGAKGGKNYKSENWHLELKEEVGGFDLIIDSALGDNFSKFIEIANPGGKIVFFGGTDGNIPNLDGRKIFWKQLEIKGTTMGSAVDFKHLLDFISLHKIQPVIDEILPIKKAQEGLLKMTSSSQFGKIIISMED